MLDYEKRNRYNLDILAKVITMREYRLKTEEFELAEFVFIIFFRIPGSWNPVVKLNYNFGCQSLR